MIRSMTGYGRFESVTEKKRIVLEIKSVNNRYLDLTVKTPRSVGYLEEKIKERISREISRGKVDVFLYIEPFVAESREITVDLPLAESYVRSFAALSESLSIPNDATVSTLARFGDIFVARAASVDEEEVWREVSACLEPALADFVAMRTREGERMVADVRSRAATLSSLREEIASRAPQLAREYASRLTETMHELLGKFEADENRLLTEVGILADRICIDEELVRLQSHLQELDRILTVGGAVGRKLDFLVQEMNRETNTIGSKAGDMAVTRAVVEMKSEIEKIREQIQNLE